MRVDVPKRGATTATRKQTTTLQDTSRHNIHAFGFSISTRHVVSAPLSAHHGCAMFFPEPDRLAMSWNVAHTLEKEIPNASATPLAAVGWNCYFTSFPSQYSDLLRVTEFSHVRPLVVDSLSLDSSICVAPREGPLARCAVRRTPSRTYWTPLGLR